ncbi:hypothetical protein ACJ73_00695 [Blastomyces percursus]|uniref:Uncharacterized protein n=1 Tax=Blastomyces percursus TaxID=1658174 RepID=A0A1J9QGE8_9EURO|nr:hypothetical protein ACJ73_00695 [Blastomyces percursus]
MVYYDTITNPSTFQRLAVSCWGVDHLYACRVLCSQPSDVLPFLADRIPRSEVRIHPCIESLIHGPKEALSELSQMAEAQIVCSYQPESLGYVWTALGNLLRPRDNDRDTRAPDNDDQGADPQGGTGGRSSGRSRTRTGHGPFVPSDTMQVASSSPMGSDDGRPDIALSVPSSIGFVESPAPLVEDYTPIKKGLSFLEFRDERLAYRYERDEERIFEAIDDGGIQFRFRRRQDQQVVGEALAFNSDAIDKISNNNIISIVAVQHYIKFIHMHITDDFMHDMQARAPADGSDVYLKAVSTNWFDMTQSSGRRSFVRHMLAMIA